MDKADSNNSVSSACAGWTSSASSASSRKSRVGYSAAVSATALCACPQVAPVLASCREICPARAKLT
jgi:hypothetical protein